MALPSVRDQFALAKRGALAQANQSLVDLAKRANAAVMAYEPRPQGFIRTVDGQRGAPEEAVKPNGIIVYDYERLEVVVLAALEILREHSPVLTGAYRDAHTIYVNGQAASERLPTINAGDDVIITNLEPYARKIEFGHMKMHVSGTDEVYQTAQQIVKQRFDNQAVVKFEMRAAPGAVPPSTPRDKRTALAYPCLVFTPR